MNISIANHNDAKNAKNFVNHKDIDFMDLPTLVRSGFAYSASEFKDNYRKNDNWISENLLILDIDEICNIQQAQKIFEPFRNFIITSRSHQKDKGGLVCDRFRVFIELDTTITDIEVRTNFITLIMNKYFFVDQSTKDRGRFFFASPMNAEVFYNYAPPMKVININIDFKPILAPVEQKREVINKSIHTDDIYVYNELRECYIDKNGNVLDYHNSNGELTDEIKLKGIESFLASNYYQGNKSACLFQASSMMLNDGFTQDYIADYLIRFWETKKAKNDKFRDAMQNIKGAFKY